MRLGRATSLPRQSPAVRGGSDKSERRVLVKYDTLPEYLKDNEYIRNYYRCEWPLRDVVLSIFKLHNETFNIWTHLVGFMIFSGMMIRSLSEKGSVQNAMAKLIGKASDGRLMSKLDNQTNDSDASSTDTHIEHFTRTPILNNTNSVPIWPWLVFLAGAMCCLIFSSVSHIFASHSRRFYYFFWRLDYAGISLMIVCSFFPPIYYIFSDHPAWRLLYLSCISLVGILVIATLLSTTLSSGRFRSFRATVFLCMGFSGVIPATHAAIIHWDQTRIFMSLVYEILMGLLYATGAVFYVTRIPERWRPGAFDIVGHSHQIFHILVVAAALSHSAATMIIMEWRRSLAANAS